MRIYRPQSTLYRDSISNIPRPGTSLNSVGLMPFELFANLVAYWRFEDNLDDAMGLYPLTPYGGTPTPVYADAKHLRGLAPKASHNAFWAQTVYTGLLNPPSLSIATWIRCISPRFCVIMAFGDGYIGHPIGYSLFMTDTSGRMSFGIKSGGVACIANGTIAISDQLWHLLVGTHDGSTVKLYLDGDREIVTTPGGARDNPSTYFGTGSLNTTALDGELDEMAILNRNPVLSPDEVLSLWNDSYGRFY